MRLEEGGVVKAVLDLCTMSQHNDEVGLATFDPSGTPSEWLDPDTTTTRVHNLTGSGHDKTLSKQQRQQLRTIIDQYDVVHLHSMWSPVNPAVASICKAIAKPYVLSVHGMLDDWCMSQRKLKKIIYMKSMGRNLLRDASVIHCTAQAELDQASAWFTPSKGCVVPLPFDLEEYKEMPEPALAYEAFDQLDPDLPKVLFLSRIHYKKGVDRLIQASALLAKRGIKHQLVIAGTGDEPYVSEMKALAKSTGVDGHTYFLGFASGQAKIALFGECDVFALPTSQENFGFVFFEALAAGTTVLTTKGTDTWAEIEQSGGGVIVENTPEAFAIGLEKILNDRDGFRSRAQGARERIFVEMTVAKVRDQYQSMYASCLA
ncbi:MAG: glycosyltransferase [Phycisphaerales bacterium]|nr:glycosyltransferase [Phycisphaerales bacterium]